MHLVHYQLLVGLLRRIINPLGRDQIVAVFVEEKAMGSYKLWRIWKTSVHKCLAGAMRSLRDADDSCKDLHNVVNSVELLGSS